jgi:hypothetical protein
MKENSNELDDFIPEDKISIDIEHTLEQMSGKFRSVNDGLPELIKNSKDHYARCGIIEKERRQIVILISRDRMRLGVLDFAGAKLSDFTGWKEWSSRTAGRKDKAGDIEAGFGNGGKAFMVRGCSKEATMCGYVDGKINKWGFKNSIPELKYRAGTFKGADGKELKNYKAGVAHEVLNEELAPFGICYDDLPESSQKVFKERERFTFVQLNGVIEWRGPRISKNRAIMKIPENIIAHSQAALTLESSTVWIQVGKALLTKKPLEVVELDPIPGLEKITPIALPEYLKDPETKAKVKVGKGTLVLKTSEHNLRSFGHNIARNVIRLKNSRNIVANWSVPALVAMPAAGFIYGHLDCSELTPDKLAGSDRTSLPDIPLTRALEYWTAQQVEELALRIQRIKASKTSEQEKDTANKTLTELRDLMKKYLLDLQSEGQGKFAGDAESDLSDEEDKKSGGHGPGKKEKEFPPVEEWGEKVNEIILEPSKTEIKIACGTIVPLIVKCYQRTDEKKLPLKQVPLVLCATEEDILGPYKGNSVKALRCGKTNILFETEKGDIKSNMLAIEVVDVKDVSIEPPDHLLKQGEKIQLNVVPLDKHKKIIKDLIYEAYVDELELAKISRNAIFVAGGVSGTATVRIKYGPNVDDVSTSSINIGEEVVEQTSSNESGLPYILLCNTPAPNTEDLPEDKRSHPGGEDYPSIIEFDPLWENIVWINPNSHEALKVRRGKGSGGTGMISISSKTFQEFLALKCFEILKRLRVRQKMGEEKDTSQRFFQELAQAEMDTSEFLEAAYGIVIKLVDGK